MAELALLDDTGTIVNLAIIGDGVDQDLIDALVAAGNHHAGVPVPDGLDPAPAIGWTYTAKGGFIAPPQPDPEPAPPPVDPAVSGP